MKQTTQTLLLAIVAAALISAPPASASESRSLLPIPRAVADADFHDDGAPSAAKVELGRMLFFDKILSGNKNIACATCHHPSLSGGDGVALPLGEGPQGLGPERRPGAVKAESVHGRVPRNSPAIFNLGAREFTRMFHDGRVEIDDRGYYESGFISQARWKLPTGLDNVLAAQAMFPVISAREMAGQKGENPVAERVSLNRAAGPGGAWDLLAERLRGIPEYVDRFRQAYPGQVSEAADINFVQAANAIAAFEAQAFRGDGSPFDEYLRGSRDAMTEQAKRGMELFYGKANCGSCHSGAFQTDHQFHAIAMPQIGPGKGDGRDAGYWRASGHESFLEDFGRGRVTVRPEDNFKFRTPSLRNVELTGPWGHSGAYQTLEGVVRHHLDPVASLESYEVEVSDLPPLGQVLELTASGSRLDQSRLVDGRLDGFLMRDDWVQRSPELRERIARANALKPVTLTDDQVDDLLAFLRALTDPSSRDLAHLVPEQVPSGLPVEDAFVRVGSHR